MDILNDLNGNFLHCCVRKKLLMRAGDTDKAEIVDTKIFLYLAKKISKTFRHIGILDIDSTPPAMNASPAPIDIRPAASCIACMLEPQNLLIVTPGTLSGRSERNEIILARLKPCSPSGKAVPTIMSSTRFGSSSRFEISEFTTFAAISSGLILAKSPFIALVNGEREYPAITEPMLYP